MTVAPGQRLGPYEITAKLGQGGMGEVYRATDTKLKRDVAIKVLPPGFTEDRERLARFEREAQLLAQLHHPNIASIFGLEESNGTRALVMELVEGPTLAERLEHGPLPFNESLSVSLQIAQALEEAHEKGIVHRDLKPQNVKASIEGKVKVLDFGLAKAMDPTGSLSGGGAGSASALAASPTLTLGATQMGVILGTAAYMSPEQAKGLPVDKRADIWAFGVVLWEMLTGRRMFEGDSVTETLAGVLKNPIDLEALPKETPESVRRLLGRCLERNPKDRLRDIGEARLLLAGPHANARELAAAPPSKAVAMPSKSGSPAATVVALVVVAALGAGAAWYAKPAPPIPTLRLSVSLPPGEQVTTAPAISPDGRMIAYVAGRSPATAKLWVRDLGDFVPRAVDGGAGATWPFFSPDGRSVAFFARARLWKAPVQGGAASSIVSAPRGFGGSWGKDGRIVYSPGLDTGLWRVPADGGAAEQLTRPDYEANGYAHVFPQILSSEHVLFTFWGRTFHTALLTLSTGAWRPATTPVSRGGVGLYATNGFVLRGDATSTLLAARWSPSTTEPARLESAVLDAVYWSPGTDRPWISIATNGTAVVVPGSPDRRQLVWVDRNGALEAIPGEPEQITHAVLSHDGRRVAHNGRQAQWVRDLVGGTRTRVAPDVTWAWVGGWTPDDQRVVFSSNRSGDWEIYTVAASGGDPELLFQRPRTQHPAAVAPDGSVIFLDYGLETGIDIWRRTPDGELVALVQTPYLDGAPAVSADGRWLAYTSDESGRTEVYARPLAVGGERIAVSLEGGTGPVWARDGRELFYRAGDDLMVVEIAASDPLRFGARRRLLDVSGFEGQYFREFDVAPDGRRFLFLRAEPVSRPTRLDLILNWFPELERKVTAR